MENNNKKLPLMVFNIEKLRENAQSINRICKENGIEVTGINKGVDGNIDVTKMFIKAGCSSIGSSRIRHLKSMVDNNIETSKMLIRIPMLSEVEDLVDYADISLNSEKIVIDKIEEICKIKNKNHKVILMYDLGDLREGMWNVKEVLDLANYIEKNLKFVKLGGIGTNISCYGSVKATVKNMNELANLANSIENLIGRELEFVSGGATSSFPLVMDKLMPKKINHLRLGESILLAIDYKTYYDIDVDFLHSDGIKLYAEIVEIQNKPSYPVGDLLIDAFGNKPEYDDNGERLRAILAIGKQDIGSHEKLIPVDSKIKIVGSSSDHLIIDILDSKLNYEIGDAVEFELYYQHMLYASLSSDVVKIAINDEC